MARHNMRTFIDILNEMYTEVNETCSGSIATAVGALGAGDPKASIYYSAKRAKRVKENDNESSTEETMDEAIKGWKHAHSDIAKMRANSGKLDKPVRIVQLKKDGTESKMYDAVGYYSTEKEADEYMDRIRELNPGRNFTWNIYVNGELKSDKPAMPIIKRNM
jgi:hypothetical protein